jgi:Ca2+-binding EF-hand superfamily protein
MSKTEEAQMNENKNITPEELKDINNAFDLFRKRDPNNPADDGVLKVNDLGLAMRNVRFTPGPVEL